LTNRKIEISHYLISSGVFPPGGTTWLETTTITILAVSSFGVSISRKSQMMTLPRIIEISHYLISSGVFSQY